MFKAPQIGLGCKERNVFQRTLLFVVYLSRFAANHSVGALYEPGRLVSNYIRFFINFYCGALHLEKL